MQTTCSGQAHNTADSLIGHRTSVSRLECQQTCADPSKCYTFFIYNRPGIKEPTLRTQRQLHNVSAAPTSLSVCLSSHPLGEGQRILFLLLLGLSV